MKLFVIVFRHNAIRTYVVILSALVCRAAEVKRNFDQAKTFLRRRHKEFKVDICKHSLLLEAFCCVRALYSLV
jgi:hypothetical protein